MAPHTFILPSIRNGSPQPTILGLPHPRTAAPTRYLLHPTSGLHEITKIAATSATPRSWLLTDSTTSTTSEPPSKDESAPVTWVGDGQVIQDGSLYLATPIDPLFLLLPHLLPCTSGEENKSHYLPIDDIIELLSNPSPDQDIAEWEPVLRPDTTSRRQIESRIRAICDSVDVGDEKAYRISTPKYLAILAKKCEAMVSSDSAGLPKSMEEEFVKKPLVRPLILGNSQLPTPLESQDTEGVASQEKDPQEQDKEDEQKKEDETPTPPAPAPPPHATVPPEPAHAKSLLRLRVASSFLSSTYLAPHIATQLSTHLTKTHDFTPLDTYLSQLKAFRIEASAIRSDDFSRKRANDDEEDDDRAEKKRKLEEEGKKKKKNVSKGVKELNKVNTRGMAKMTSFFKKKE